MWRSPELELNDIGFLRQADEIRQFGIVTYQTLKPFGKFRKIFNRFEQFSSYDFDGNFNRVQYTLTSNATSKTIGMSTGNSFINPEFIPIRFCKVARVFGIRKSFFSTSILALTAEKNQFLWRNISF